MTQPPLTTAFRVLERFDPRHARLDERLAALRDGTQDGGFGVVAGLADAALRHAPIIDLLISHVSTMKPGRMERAVLWALRLGIASWIRGTPSHAACNETVGLLPPQSRAKGLVNAVMRRVTEIATTRELTAGEQAGLRDARPDALAALVTPRRMPFHNLRLIEGTFDLFPAGAAGRLELLAGFPAWLAARLRHSLDDEEFARVAVAAAEPPALWLRIVRGQETIAGEALAAIPHERRGDALRFDSAASRAVLHSPAFAAGAFAVQDYAAQLPIPAARPRPGSLCLDLCAAPGGKTCQLAEAVLPEGKVLAFDTGEDKLKRVLENVARLHLNNVATAFGDGRTVKLAYAGEYDVALVDAPCSNTGVMGRRPEVPHRLREADIAGLAGMQRALIDNAARHLRPGGTLVYSTCSLLDEENGALVRAFLDAEGGEDSGWRFTDEATTLPAAGQHDGGYYAILRAPDAS